MSLITIIFVIFVTFPFGSAELEANEPSVTVLTRDGEPIAGPAARYGFTYEKKHSLPIEVQQRQFQDLYDEIMMGFVTGQVSADVFLIPSAWLPDFAPYLSVVPKDLLQSKVVQDIHPTYRDALMRWDDQWKALTVDGDMHMGAYRKDLFLDSQLQNQFSQTYGYSLRPPDTWIEYQHIAEFFNGKVDSQGRRLAGTIEAYSKGGQRLWYLFSHVASYASHPDYPGHMFFDPQSMKPSINNPAWQRALDEYLNIAKLVPDNSSSLDSHEVRSRFSRGEVAMAIDWTDIGVLAASEENSVVSDNIGFFQLPGSREVWNPRSGKWDSLDSPRRVPFLAFGGWIGVVPEASEHHDLAWSYLAWYAKPEHSMNDVTDGTSGINPYRLSQLNNTLPWYSVMGKVLADEYLNVLRQSLASSYTARDLRIPGYRAYMAVLDDQIEQVIQQEISLEEALQNTSVYWEQITDRLGRQSQLKHYREAMGLPEISP